eukprot:TRINITY_DN15094_c0_g1_i1.p1 TRINITY_DN15094_c0_g1~~TRINITY_DN15094_c0_g1_i1.p1  ORF type:complete len:294 (+),score=53.77 TRINITY_DN15094_c0_g1_i1:61-882(+)
MAAAAAAASLPIAVVTGANTGIGLHTAGMLASRGYRVVMACRSEERARRAIEGLRLEHGDGIQAEFLELDLSSFASVRSFASQLSSLAGDLQLLVCNAGLNSASVSESPDEQLTRDGVDVVYQTNFLSHLLLTILVMPLLCRARGRVVNVTSVMHRSASADQLPLARRVREPYVSLYGLSKLAQIASSAELHRRCRGRVAFHCVNPGGVASDIWRGYPAWQRWAFGALLASPARAAETVASACVCEEGAPPAAPRHWNGYFGIGVLTLLALHS